MQDELTALDYQHAQLVQQMRCLASCPDTEVLQIFTNVLDSLEQLFALENRLMDIHQFPGSRCHVEQHARVLAGLHRAHSQLMRGEVRQGRYAGTHLLMRWFELHNGTMDACLMAWLEFMQDQRAMTSIPRGTLSPQIMRDLTRTARYRWRALRANDESKAARSSRQNRQGTGKQ